MTSALIGYTGFVGGNLARQMKFDELYNSKNIEKIRGREFDLVVCAGAPGAKWYANEYPDEDAESLRRLRLALCEVETDRMVLISTIDAMVAWEQPYGRGRRFLERFVAAAWENVWILRLPSLFGQSLRKNALYDLMVEQRLDDIAPNATYQWYPLRRLGDDLYRILSGDECVITLASEPVAMEEIRRRFFPRLEIGPPRDDAPHYNVKGHPDYSLTKAEVFDEMGAFLAGYA